MRLFPAIITLMLLMSVSLAQSNSDTTEGGNITELEVNYTTTTDYWAGIVGWLNGSLINASLPVSFQPVNESNVYTNEPNGSYATYHNYAMMVTRLPFRPNVSDITTPSPADFGEGGMFDNFTAFAGLNTSSLTDGPLKTFCSPACVYGTCYIENTSFSCPIVILRQNIPMGVLKFSNGTTEEPLFVTLIDSRIGYNGTLFDFEYMVPTFEDYYFYIYISDMAPTVTIITPQPTTYPTGIIPFAYTITDDYGVDSCWYVLDGVTVNMPVCGPPYILNVGDGMHLITLYANDTVGNIGSDSVLFRVERVAPKPPPGGGPPGVPFYPEEMPPVIPPTPQEPKMNILPMEITVVVDYPEEGSADFSLSSDFPLGDVSCSATGDFSRYTSVEIGSTVPANGTIEGTIIVDMSPADILDYRGSTVGTLQCFGETPEGYMASISAKVNLVLHKPRVTLENVTIEAMQGEEIEDIIGFLNTGDFNATAINISVEFTGAYRNLIEITDITSYLEHMERGYVGFTIRTPGDLEPGEYNIPMDVSENGRRIGTGHLTFIVLPKPVFPICLVPDLIWTILILLLGIITSAWVFLKKLARVRMMKMKAVPKKKDLRHYWKYYRQPFVYAALTMLVFFVVWVIVVLLLAQCQ